MKWLGLMALGLPVMAAACGDSSGTNSSSALDGPIMRYPRPAPSDEALDAEVRGRLEIEGNCLYVARDIGERYPVVWPAGTTWDAENGAVTAPSMNPMPIGSEVSGGGGYLGVEDVERLLGAEAAALASHCVENAHGEIAFVNNADDAIGPADDDASVGAGRGPGVEASTQLADRLLTTSKVQGVVEGLEEDEYRTGDHAVLAPAERVGWSDQAIRGVARQWVRAYDWRSGDAVPERVVHVSSTIFEFQSRTHAEAAVDRLRAEVPLGTPMRGAPPGYAAYGPQEHAYPSNVRSWFGLKVQGRHVISVQLGAVGELDPSEEFLALLELSSQQSGY